MRCSVFVKNLNVKYIDLNVGILKIINGLDYIDKQNICLWVIYTSFLRFLFDLVKIQVRKNYLSVIFVKENCFSKLIFKASCYIF